METTTVNQKDIHSYLSDPKNWDDPTKGILLFGKTGRGKTTAIRKLHQNLIHVAELPSYIQEYGPTWHKRLWNDQMIIDDLGDNPVVYRYMGTDYFPQAQIIDARLSATDYNLTVRQAWEWDNSQGHARGTIPTLKMTHFTTNKDPQVLSDLLGNRAFSRLHKLCNFVELEGDDYRTL